MAFRIERRYVEEMIAHARADAPNECCGVLLGPAGQIVRLVRVTNAEQSPYRYSMPPSEVLAFYREAWGNSWDVLAIYHSHTHTAAYPSPTDVRLASEPDAVYILVSLEHAERPAVRGFHIRDDVISEEALEIVDEPGPGPAD